MCKVQCGGHNEAVQGVHGLRVADAVPVWGLWGVAVSLTACWVRRCRVFSGCAVCVCGFVGMCCRGVGEWSPVHFGRAGQLFGAL